MTSCGRSNDRKHKDIKNGEQFIILDIYYKLDFLNKKEFTSLESRDYMGIPGKGLSPSLVLRTKIPNKKKRQGLLLLTLLTSIL